MSVHFDQRSRSCVAIKSRPSDLKWSVEMSPRLTKKRRHPFYLPLDLHRTIVISRGGLSIAINRDRYNFFDGPLRLNDV